jgi:hypothetical protein
MNNYGYYPNNLINMQYNYLRNNPGFFPNNYTYQYNGQVPYQLSSDEKKKPKNLAED